MVDFPERRWLAALVVAAAAGPALAHHGWAWTEDAESRLSGTIESIHLGNPHAQITMRNDAGRWRVDLSPPSLTARSGLVEGVAAKGDPVSFTGHRSRDPKELTFKAETVTVRGKTFDVYPDRPKTLKPAP